MSPSATADIEQTTTFPSKNGTHKDAEHIHGGQGMTPLEAISHGDVKLQGTSVLILPAFRQRAHAILYDAVSELTPD
jgi:hypothetical protein